MRAAAILVAVTLLLPAPAAQAVDAGHGFLRGINISSLFSFPKEDGWPPFRDPRASISDDELAALSRAGFDFIRLPVYPTPFDAAPAHLRAELMADVATFVRRANVAGLAVMVAGFPTHSPTAWRPERDGAAGVASFESYARWLEEITRTVADAANGGGAAIQLMNEPQAVCTIENGIDWAEYQMALHARVRAVADLPIVLTGGCWSQIDGLLRLSSIPDDPNTLFDVHYYLPFAYTHQGATWATPILAYVGGLRFPPEATDRGEAWRAVLELVVADHAGESPEAAETAREALAEVDRYIDSTDWIARIGDDFARLARWADERGISRGRLVLGEFGAIRPSDEGPDEVASRQRYLRTVRQAAESQGFAWAMWEYYSPFGLTQDDTSRELVPGTLEALGLDGPATYGMEGHHGN